MYDSIIISELETVINACLSEEEKANVEGGASAQIRLIIRVSPQKVSVEDKVKAETGVGSRCIPLQQRKIAGKCVCCGKDAQHMVCWGIAY